LNVFGDKYTGVLVNSVEGISNFHSLVTACTFRLASDLLFFTAFGGMCHLSKKVSKKGHRRRLHPGGGGFPDLALVLL
jgi:hypothetical protein